jgi:hypothetical protein
MGSAIITIRLVSLFHLFQRHRCSMALLNSEIDRL